MKKRVISILSMLCLTGFLICGCSKKEEKVIAEVQTEEEESMPTETPAPLETPSPEEMPEVTPTPTEEAEKPIVSAEEAEEETTSPVEENVVIDPSIAAEELGKKEENMLAIMDSLNMCMAEQGYQYDVNNAQFFWTALAYTIGNYPNLRDNESNGTLTYNPEGYYRVYYKLVQEYASGIFADYSNLPELPEIGMVGKDADPEYYHFYVGDRGTTYGVLDSWKNNGDGTYTAVTKLVSSFDHSEIAAYEYVLVKNSYADGISNPMFVYAIKSVTKK